MSNYRKGAVAILAVTLLLFTPVLAHAEGTPTPTATATQTAVTSTPTTVPAPNLTIGATSVVAGSAVTVSWANIANPSATDWIGIYQPDDANNAQIDWVYVSGTKTAGEAKASGSVSFTIPATLQDGDYEFRLLAANGFTRLATSSLIEVTATPATATPSPTATLTPTSTATATVTSTPTTVPAPSLSVSTTTIAAGSAVTVSWSSIANPSATDWIGLYRPGETDMSQLDWVYVSGTKTAGDAKASGSVSFTIPATTAAGSYEFRLFAANVYTKLATSSQVTVTAGTATATATPTSTATATTTATPTQTTDDDDDDDDDDWRTIVVPAPEGNRKANHGWFVSWIAHFTKTLDDIRHGLVVSFFARSDLGKEAKQNDTDDKAKHKNTDDDDATPSPTATATGTAQPTATSTPTATATPTATPTSTATATTEPTVTPTSDATQQPTDREKDKDKDKEKEKEKEKHQGDDRRDGNKERNRLDSEDEENEEEADLSSNSGRNEIKKSEKRPAEIGLSVDQSPDPRGPKEVGKEGDGGDLVSPEMDEEQTSRGGNQQAPGLDRKRDRAGDDTEADESSEQDQQSRDKPSPSGSNRGRDR